MTFYAHIARASGFDTKKRPFIAAKRMQICSETNADLLILVITGFGLYSESMCSKDFMRDTHMDFLVYDRLPNPLLLSSEEAVKYTKCTQVVRRFPERSQSTTKNTECVTIYDFTQALFLGYAINTKHNIKDTLLVNLL